MTTMDDVGSEPMTREQIDEVLDRVRTWPLHRQEDAAAILLRMEKEGTDVYVMTDEELADIEEALAEVERGEIASDEEVQAIFDRARRL